VKKSDLLLFIFLLTFTFVVPMQAFAAEPQYSDMKEHWSKEEVIDASGLGIFQGYGGKFHPNDDITRAQFVTALIRAMDVDIQSSKASFDFQDVKQGKWYYEYVQAAIHVGFIKEGDYAVTFEPDQAISRGEIARMIARAVQPYANVPAVQKTFKDVRPTDTFAPYIEQAAGYGIIKGYKDETFQPERSATRAEAAVMMMRAMKVMPQQGPYHIQLQGIENSAGPSFAINQVMAGMRNIYNYENSTDFTVLNQFADPQVVKELENVFQQFAEDQEGMMLFAEGSPLLPKFISRTMAIVEQENITFFKRSPEDKAFSGQYTVAENITWYLKFEDGQWKVHSVKNFKLPTTWEKIENEDEIPPHIAYKFEIELGTFFGKINLSPGAESYVSGHIKQLFKDAGSDNLTIYAIGGHPVAKTTWAEEVKQWESDPPRGDYAGKVRFLLYENSSGELSLVWLSNEDMAVGFYVSFTNLRKVQIVGVDHVSWSKIWDQPLWSEIIKQETYDTIYDNASKYEQQIKEILQKAN
jgi:hypothetical protein